MFERLKIGLIAFLVRSDVALMQLFGKTKSEPCCGDCGLPKDKWVKPETAQEIAANKALQEVIKTPVTVSPEIWKAVIGDTHYLLKYTSITRKADYAASELNDGYMIVDRRYCSFGDDFSINTKDQNAVLSFIPGGIYMAVACVKINRERREDLLTRWYYESPGLSHGASYRSLISHVVVTTLMKMKVGELTMKGSYSVPAPSTWKFTEIPLTSISSPG
jgi:hypothetical protein